MGELRPNVAGDNPLNQMRKLSSRLDFDGIELLIEHLQQSSTAVNEINPRETFQTGKAWIDPYWTPAALPKLALFLWEIAANTASSGGSITRVNPLYGTTNAGLTKQSGNTVYPSLHDDGAGFDAANNDSISLQSPIAISGTTPFTFVGVGTLGASGANWSCIGSSASNTVVGQIGSVPQFVSDGVNVSLQGTLLPTGLVVIVAGYDGAGNATLQWTGNPAGISGSFTPDTFTFNAIGNSSQVTDAGGTNRQQMQLLTVGTNIVGTPAMETLLAWINNNTGANIGGIVTSGLWTSITSDPISDLLVWQITKTRGTIPGPWIPITRWDRYLGAVAGQKRVVQNTGQVQTLTPTGGTSFAPYDGSSLIALEVQETWSDGSGSAGNPAYPISIDDYYDKMHGATHVVTQAVADITSTATLAINGQTVTDTDYMSMPENPNLRLKVVTTYQLNGMTFGPWFDYTNIPLPDVLTGLNVTSTASSGSGQDLHPAGTAAFTDGGSIALHPTARSQASAAIMPEVQPLIESVWSRKLPSTNFAVYAATMTLEQILATATQLCIANSLFGMAFATITITIGTSTINWTGHGLSNGQTVLFSTTGALPTGISATRVYYVANEATNTFQLAPTYAAAIAGTPLVSLSGTQSGTQSAAAAARPLPIFKTGFYTISMFGQHLSASANAESTAIYSSSNSGSRQASSESGNGFGKESGVMVKSIRVGPVINALINGYTTSFSEGPVTVSVSANTPAIVDGSGTTQVAAITNAPSATSITANGTVTPTSIGPTSVTAIPTSGIYLTDTSPNPNQYGTLMGHIEIVDFSVLA